MPIIGRGPKRSDFQYLIDQVKNRLASSAARHLSFVGCVTLSKTVNGKLVRGSHSSFICHATKKDNPQKVGGYRLISGIFLNLIL